MTQTSTSTSSGAPSRTTGKGGGSKGDLMRLMGWTDRAMVDRYAEDLQVQRAIEAKQRRGDMYLPSLLGGN